MPSSTSSWLRQHTRAEHAAAEGGLDVRRLQRPTDLVGLLQGWDLVWRAVLGAASSPGAAPDARAELLVPARQAVAWLHSDLVDLEGLTGDGHAPVPVHPLQPGGAVGHGPAVGPAVRSALAGLLAEPASAWGLAYVLRGSRLGGSVIAPQVRLGLGLPPQCGTAFLASRGSDPGREWVAFRRRLDALGQGPVDLLRAGTAARWTFEWVGAVTARGLFAGTTSGPERHRLPPDVGSV